MRHVLSIAALPAVLALGIAALISQASADPFNPFAEPEAERPKSGKSSEPPAPAQDRPYLQPMDGRRPQGGGQSQYMDDAPPAGGLDEKSRSVEREEIAPVLAQDGSGLPYELWRGLSLAELEQLIANLEIPPRSLALHSLWRRLITSAVTPPPGGQNNAYFTVLRVEALDRSGLIAEAADLLAKDATGTSDPVIATLLARSEIRLGNIERGCEIAKGAEAAKPTLPRDLKVDGILMSGYCALRAGDTIAAGLKAGLAREVAAEGALGPDALDAAASGAAAHIGGAKKVSLLDYRILEGKGDIEQGGLIAAATPNLLASLALSPATQPGLRLEAGERAAALNAISPNDLGAIYRAAGGAAATERSKLFMAAESERTPLKKARLIRAFLDNARHAQLYWPALELMAKPALSLEPVPEIGWFAETAIEASLATGNFDRARAWANFGSSLDAQAGGKGFGHWIALADIADPAVKTGHATSLASVEDMALSGRFDPALLHRLASVLDALDINVPIPLWDLASRTPQPTDGHLPDTGVLSALSEASKKKEFGRTVLLAMQTLGPNGAEGASLIALGDSIRALKRAGFEAEARRLGFEALFAAWPRAVSN
jgi:hypothetical protein